MALKALMLRAKLNALRKAQEELGAKDGEFAAREAELEAAIADAERGTDEDRAAAEGLVDDFERERAAHEGEKQRLAGEIAQAEADLAAEEAKAPAPAPAAPPPEVVSERGNDNNDTRKDDHRMKCRSRAFGRMSAQERAGFVAREEVHEFLERVRSLAGEKRAVSGAELTIPEVVLGLLREDVTESSKLLGRVNRQSVPGRARQNIMGSVPEAIWTEACAALNELDLDFAAVEVDGYKVGGFFAVCNAVLEDSDVNLADTLLDALSRAIGKAVDKAILFGTGVKMPLGIITRLAQTAEPSGYPESAPAWVDLHSSHVIALPSGSGAAFFQGLVAATANLNDKYAAGELTWVMNKKTKNRVLVEGLTINAAGAVVSGIGNTMPVAGGEIVTLDCMADGDMLVGYFGDYLVAERAGTALAQSEHVRFLQDQTVFKGTARYDGTPVIPDAFVLLNVANTAPTTSVDFPPDEANAFGPGVVAVVTDLTLTPAQWSAETTAYTASTTDESNTIAAIPSTGAVVELRLGNTLVQNGAPIAWADGANTVKLTAKQGGASKVYTLTVTKS